MRQTEQGLEKELGDWKTPGMAMNRWVDGLEWTLPPERKDGNFTTFMLDQRCERQPAL